MTDHQDVPITPVDYPLPMPADHRIEAMEAMIRSLSDRVEQMAIPSQSHPLLSTLVSLIPNPVGIPSPLIPIRNRRFDSGLAVEKYRLRDRYPVFRA
jgi:hypothetical protein